MKNLTQHIQEKLQITRNKSRHTLFPKTKEELINIINKEIELKGVRCPLNHIDVSKITNMAKVFYQSEFNGDISKWDVSNVEDMSGMFMNSNFTGENGDISDWDVSNVKDMWGMFQRSKFNGNISDWDVSNLTTINSNIFWDCPLQNNPPKWFKK